MNFDNIVRYTMVLSVSLWLNESDKKIWSFVILIYL